MTTIQQVSVYDLTDDQITALSPLDNEPPSHPDDDAYWQGVIDARRRADNRTETDRIAVTRRCTRCGIDTTAPDLCGDCLDVLALDGAA